MSRDRQRVFVGIDVAFAKKKRLPICVCSMTEGKLQPIDLRSTFDKPPAGRGNIAAMSERERTDFASEVVRWLADLESKRVVRIERIAIDAPRDFANGQRRAAERAMDSRKISCFTTPTRKEFKNKIAEAKRHLDGGGEVSKLPNANQFWMLVGFALFRALEKKYECLEVFPQAIVRAMGCIGDHKSTAYGINEQIQEFAKVTGASEKTVRSNLKSSGFGSTHDRLDALLSAWIASLPDEDRIACGTPPNDVIWIPNVAKLKAEGLKAKEKVKG